MYSSKSIYNIKVVSTDATFENFGKYSVQVNEDDGRRIVKSSIVMQEVELEKNKVICNSDSLLPIESHIYMNRGEVQIELEAIYKKKSIELTAKTTNGEHRKKLKVNYAVYDNLQVYDLISKLDFTKEKKVILNILNIQTSVIEEYEVEYCCFEEVNISDKVYDCTRVSLSRVIDSTEKQFLLYSNCGDRKLIRVINKGQVLEFLENS